LTIEVSLSKRPTQPHLKPEKRSIETPPSPLFFKENFKNGPPFPPPRTKYKCLKIPLPQKKRKTQQANSKCKVIVFALAPMKLPSPHPKLEKTGKQNAPHASPIPLLSIKPIAHLMEIYPCPVHIKVMQVKFLLLFNCT